MSSDALTTISSSGGACCAKRHSQGEDADADAPCCFICLGGADAAPLETPCKCPRAVHRACMARWQLQRAGRDEERHCRFCQAALPDWRGAFGHMPLETPTFTVVYQGVSHSIMVRPGEEGIAEFEQKIR